MAETAVEQDPVVEATIARLVSTGFRVGDHKKPPADMAGPDFPYSVVYSLPDFSRSGTWADGQADAVHQIQVTAVGKTATQARRLQDKNRAAMRTGPFNVAGRTVQLVDLAEGGRAPREDNDQPSLFSAVDVWRIYTTPRP